jgi:hypothetical protein
MLDKPKTDYWELVEAGKLANSNSSNHDSISASNVS